MSSVDEARLASLLRLAIDHSGRRSRLIDGLRLVTPEELAAYALAKPGAWPDTPWENDQVAKVSDGRGAGKIFAFLGSETLGVKCGAGREVADEWLDRYPQDASVMAYIGRSGWNTLRIDGEIPDDELLEAVDVSYELVVSKLPKRHRPEGWDTAS